MLFHSYRAAIKMNTHLPANQNQESNRTVAYFCYVIWLGLTCISAYTQIMWQSLTPGADAERGFVHSASHFSSQLLHSSLQLILVLAQLPHSEHLQPGQRFICRYRNNTQLITWYVFIHGKEWQLLKINSDSCIMFSIKLVSSACSCQIKNTPGTRMCSP